MSSRFAGKRMAGDRRRSNPPSCSPEDYQSVRWQADGRTQYDMWACQLGQVGLVVGNTSNGHVHCGMANDLDDNGTSMRRVSCL
ncbi:hypothetical protein F0562_009836 [Nyssa sinensis]|uniref:Uncharacterized protein n=1 Tax=Nyssa sinensis TaxID=561372 RepID=A0A5J4ZX69_9ASTE|nr:hypothetical protein F0562_009836 [Nyssa sinensis]